MKDITDGVAYTSTYQNFNNQQRENQRILHKLEKMNKVKDEYTKLNKMHL